MTRAAALAKAQKVLGRLAAIKSERCYLFDKPGKDGRIYCSAMQAHERGECPGRKPVYLIGRIMLGLFFEVKGQGATWEKAFAQYEANEAKDHADFVARRAALAKGPAK